MPLDSRHVVNLKGRSYPVYAGVLHEAHERGLLTLTTQILQLPTAENGHVAVVQATATFEGDKVFSDIGDASPQNVARHLVDALIRMASTRAKGRALRDACDIGDTLLEELPEAEQALAKREPEPAAAPSNGQGRPAAGAPPQRTLTEMRQAAARWIDEARELGVPWQARWDINVGSATEQKLTELCRELKPLVLAAREEAAAAADPFITDDDFPGPAQRQGA